MADDSRCLPHPAEWDRQPTGQLPRPVEEPCGHRRELPAARYSMWLCLSPTGLSAFLPAILAYRGANHSSIALYPRTIEHLLAS